MEDIEAFSRAYRAKLDEAEVAKSLPENLSLEVYFYFSLLTFLLPFSWFLFFGLSFFYVKWLGRHTLQISRNKTVSKGLRLVV